ncbi:MAG: hypothetical protein ACREAB_02575 [Blastocatellia bacterium]
MKPESEHSKPIIADFEEAAPTHSSTWRKIIPFWLTTRIGLSLLALFCSSSLPFSPLEKQVAVWPPSAPLSRWLTRVFLEPWNRWDVEHFLKIAERGYRPEDGTSSFHPLYPLLGKLAGLLTGGNELLGLFIISNVCAVLFLISLERLASFDLPKPVAQRVPFYFLMMPTAFIMFAPYTEPLFLLCSTLCLISAREGRWFAAGLAGGLAVLTRQQGIFLLLPLAIEFWQWAGGSLQGLKKRLIKALNLLLVPTFMLAWLVYRAAALSDVSFDWRQPRSLIYGLLISQSATQVVADQSFIPPWQAISIAIKAFSATNAIDLLAGSFYVLVLILGAKQLWRMRISYLLYVVVVLTVSFSYSTGTSWSYMGLPRHCLLAFPLVFLLADWSVKRSAHLIISLLGSLWLIFLTMFYTFHRLWLP